VPRLGNSGARSTRGRGERCNWEKRGQHKRKLGLKLSREKEAYRNGAEWFGGWGPETNATKGREKKIGEDTKSFLGAQQLTRVMNDAGDCCPWAIFSAKEAGKARSKG